MKRISLLIVALVLGSLVLSACGETATPTPVQGNTGSNPGAQAATENKSAGHHGHDERRQPNEAPRRRRAAVSRQKALQFPQGPVTRGKLL